MTGRFPAPEPGDQHEIPAPRRGRIAYLTLGWLCVGLGTAGVLLPVLPGAPFLIVALWAFSRSSQRFHNWLLNHRLLGKPIRMWQESNGIPRWVRVVAITSMAASFAWLALGVDAPWYVLSGVAVLMIMGAAYILRNTAPRGDRGPAD